MNPAAVQAADMDFLVNKKDLADCKFVAGRTRQDLARLLPGQVLLRVDKFGLVSNNITYAVTGDALAYWQLFPEAVEAGWGRIPVWGVGEVIGSNHPDIAEGERLYGIYPMSTHAVVELALIAGDRFIETSGHRQDRPELYKWYIRCDTAATADRRREDIEVVLRPLLIGAYLIDEFLAENHYFGARAVILSSASSKTALGLAFLLSQRPGRTYEIVGLTAAANGAFVKRTGFVDRVIGYDCIDSLTNDRDIVFVDMAGNGDVFRTVHRHFGDRVKYSCRVGATHWRQQAPAAGLPGAEPVLFFGPAEIEKRIREWGMEVFLSRSEEAWERLADMAASRITFVRRTGQESIHSTYLDLLSGRSKAEDGHVLSW